MQVVHLLAVTPEERQLAEGVKALRAALNESQQQFSHRLGVSLSTVSRYELKNPPEGDVLLKLAQIATKAGREDLGVLFEARFRSELNGKSEIARAIRHLRIKFGETQQAFAQRTGLSVVSIARFEANSMPSPAILERLAKLAEENGLQDEALIFRKTFIPYLSYTPEQRRRADVKDALLKSIESLDVERLDAIEAVLGIDSPGQLQPQQKRGRVSKALELLRSIVNTETHDAPHRRTNLDLWQPVRIDDETDQNRFAQKLAGEKAEAVGARITKIRTNLSKHFRSERELTEICALAWLLESGVRRVELDNFLGEQIYGLLLDRDTPLTEDEFRVLGFLAAGMQTSYFKGDDDLTFPLAVRKLRQLLGMTRSQFAAKLRVSTTLVEQIEVGSAMPWRDTFGRLQSIANHANEISKVIREAHWKATGHVSPPRGIRYYEDDPEKALRSDEIRPYFLTFLRLLDISPNSRALKTIEAALEGWKSKEPQGDLIRTFAEVFVEQKDPTAIRVIKSVLEPWLLLTNQEHAAAGRTATQAHELLEPKPN